MGDFACWWSCIGKGLRAACEAGLFIVYSTFHDCNNYYVSVNKEFAVFVYVQEDRSQSSQHLMRWCPGPRGGLEGGGLEELIRECLPRKS